jgi:hypothetical protein
MDVTASDTTAPPPGDHAMSYTEAKEIALLRLELRASCDAGDRAAADAALTRLSQLVDQVGHDHELVAEVRRWMIKLGAA